jgi:S1-C subfamily serine protease
MSAHSIHLRSENPSLLVEFNLPPGSHARIGAALDAEISLPLASLAEYVCIIGCTPVGRLYVSDTDGGNQRYMELPAALPLPPYQFVIFHPADAVEKMPTSTVGLKDAMPLGKAFRRFVPAVIIAAAVIGLTALIILNQSKKPTATPLRPQATSTPATQQTPPQETQPHDKKEVAKTLAPEPAAEIKPAPVEPKPVTKPEPPTAKLDLEALAQRVAPAVFLLEVKDGVGNPIGTGTAFAVSADGLAVTNFHVVEHGATFTARTTQGAEFAVSGVTATDPAADLALIAIKGTGLQFLELGESESLKTGAPVAVYGCPQGLTGTLSNGILSSRRSEPEIVGPSAANGGCLLQITAPISPGSSGSPVIDQTGKVIGVAVAILNGKATQNLNFVIPVETVKKLRKDSLAGLAQGFSAARRNITPDSPKPSDSDDSPDAVLSRDPDFQSAERHYREADWIEMQKVSKRLVAKYPESPTAHLFLGLSLSALGLHESAEIEAKRGLAISADNAALWLLLGSEQLDQFKHSEARISLKKSAAISPEFSATWQRLSASYLVSGEYLGAVSPLEQLRRLDRPEFERLLGVLRSLRVHPPELRALLDHFDNLSEGIGTAAEAPTTPENLAAVLVSAFLKHGEGQDIQIELADYAATVNPYFDQGQQGRTAILKDLTTYRAQWPKRSLRLLGIESARRDDVNTLEATYRLRFSASDGKRDRSGTLVQGIRYTLINGRWLVSGIQTIEREAN